MMGPHVRDGGRCANKTVERKAPKWCTFSPDDPKTSMELNCSVEMRMVKGTFSIRSLKSFCYLVSNFLLRYMRCFRKIGIILQSNNLTNSCSNDLKF